MFEESRFNLRDNLADFLQIEFAASQTGSLVTTPAENVAARLGLQWQPTPNAVSFNELAERIVCRAENGPIRPLA